MSASSVAFGCRLMVMVARVGCVLNETRRAEAGVLGIDKFDESVVVVEFDPKEDARFRFSSGSSCRCEEVLDVLTALWPTLLVGDASFGDADSAAFKGDALAGRAIHASLVVVLLDTDIEPSDGARRARRLRHSIAPLPADPANISCESVLTGTGGARSGGSATAPALAPAVSPCNAAAAEGQIGCRAR
eukprot:gene18158-27979_t